MLRLLEWNWNGNCFPCIITLVASLLTRILFSLPSFKFYFSQFPNYGSSRANQRGWCVGRGPTPNEVGRWEQHRSLRVGLRHQVDASLLRHCHPFHRTRSSLGLSLLLGQLLRRRMEASTHLPISRHHPSLPPPRTSICRVKSPPSFSLSVFSFSLPLIHLRSN